MVSTHNLVCVRSFQLGDILTTDRVDVCRSWIFEAVDLDEICARKFTNSAATLFCAALASGIELSHFSFSALSQEGE